MNAQTTSTARSQHLVRRAAKAHSSLSRNHPGLLASLGFAALLLVSAPASAQVAPNLLTAGSYSILAGSQVTNTGTSSISGDVGISPGTAGPGLNHPGLTPVMVGGTIHDVDVQAANAMFDQAAAYTQLDLANGCTSTYPGAFGELAGQNLVPGVYCATEFRLSSGTLTLTGLASDTWVFKSASGLIITGGASANVVSPSCDVWWRVVSTASFDANSSLIGNILADTSITLAAGASLSGKAFARTAAVTLSSNAISACLAALATPTLDNPSPLPNVPLGGSISDSKVLSGGVNVPQGTITFDLYGPNDAFCTGAVIFTSTVSVDGNGTYTSTPSFTPTIAGTYRWIANYSGDANNAPTANACNATNESVVVTALAAGGGIGVPTLSEWAMIMLAALLAFAGFAAMRRKAR